MGTIVDRTDAKQIAASLSKDEKRCLLTWDNPDVTNRSAVPDSIWHGRLSHLRRTWNQADNSAFSPLGQSVRAILKEQDDG